MSSRLGGERWKALSPHLDRALEMPSHERGPWLDALATDDPALAADLRSLLADHQLLGKDGFLEDGLAAFARGGTRAGETIGAYTLEALVGEGGMGSVWRARRSDGRFEGRVAVKFLRAAISVTAAARFRREGSILARLTHRAIAHLIDAGVTSAGQPYLVLEYVEGEHIDRYCDRLALGVEARVRLFLDALSAVSHAHGHLVVHRDIKPSNVLVRHDGQLKLVDFGIAKLLESEDASSAGERTVLTREGDRALTPQFAAPEQVSGQAITTSTDVYSLGVLLYTLLSGHRPFDDTVLSAVELLQAVVDTDPPCLSEAATSGAEPERVAARRSTTPARLRRDLQGDLDVIVHRAMKKTPAERYPSVEVFADDLRRHLNHEPIRARGDSLTYRAVKLVRRHRTLSAVIALAIVATLTALGAAVWQANEAGRQRDRALRLLARSDALTEFYGFLLNDAGPPDRPLTIRAMLARSESLLNNEFAGNPEHQAAILAVQGTYYATLGEAADAESRLKRAQPLAAQSGDVDLRASIDCEHGYAVSMLGQVEEGIREIERVLAGPPVSPPIAAHCHQARAFIAQNQNDGATADAAARAAQEALRRADRPYPAVEASLLADRGYAQQLLGRLDEANRFFSQALEQMTRLGRQQTPGALTIRNNWGIAILSSGDIKRALTVYEDALRAAQARDKESAPPAFLTANLAKTFELAGRHSDALQLYEEAERVGRINSRVDSLAFALLGQASVHVERGDVDRAERLIQDLRAALGGSIPAGPPALTVMQLSGRIALQRGRLDEARRLLRDTLAGTPSGKGRPNSLRVMTRLYLADVELRAKQPREAAALAQSALEEAQALQGGIRHSNRTGMSYLRLAEAQHALGDTAAARQALASALAHLDEALGAAHPATQRALALRAGVGL